MSRPARFIKDLATDDIITRMLAYARREAQCLRALRERMDDVDDVLDEALETYESALAPGRCDEDEATAAMDWLRFIVAESFDPVFEDPAEELTRLQRYLVTASLVAAEAGELPDET
ncbi:TPA: hypothetical protein I8V91_002100 [Corynebacterium striatum]|nr:hypothetical protein [Corynebacterium striatum]HAT1254301.1 hypothetical protein [Corynebacterium striatum]HAT1266544.1 hypothetical protein [Corynebacterium striatum]HAT1313571.1 hypothetical protein [Corynebacterium striatum]HAT1318904.1 hypothetical protein [Corynebacterium striatum]